MLLCDVLVLEKTDHLSGAVGGLGLGFFAGMALGYGAAVLANPEATSEERGWRGMYALTGGIAGGTVGIAVGAIAGSRVEYEIIHPVAPPDSSTAILYSLLLIPAALSKISAFDTPAASYIAKMFSSGVSGGTV